MLKHPNFHSAVFRLRWIHAALSLSRSEEEVMIVEAEMEMAHASYHAYANEWTGRAMRMANHPGAQAFALNQHSIWEVQANRAKQHFNEIVGREVII
jgi:hypothetical protein